MKLAPMHIIRAAVTAVALLAGSQAKAGLLGYWNFDGPPSATTTDRLKDQSGNNFHGNDRNNGGANRVLFNNQDIPHAPLLPPPGNDNYCLDLTGADRYVIMEGTNAVPGPNIAAPGAVDTRGNAFNIGNSSSLNQPISSGKLTVSFFFKGLPNNNWGNYVAKGGENFATPGIPSGSWEGWAVRRNNNNNRIAFTTRNFGLLGGNGDGDSGQDFAARSGGTLATPQLGTVAFPTATGIYSDNHASGVWQHMACVWDGTWKHWYVNGYQVRSEGVTTGVNIGTMSRLCFGADENPNNGVIGNGPRFSRTRLDEISIWDEALTPAKIEDLARGADPRKPLRASIRPFDFGWPKGTTSTYSSFYQAGFGAANAIDSNLTNKYWNTAGPYSGLIVTNASATAQSFVITTAPDFPDRDPATYELYGTTAAISSADNSGGRAEAQSWILISSGALPATAGRSTAMAPVDITSPGAYTAYKFIFPTLSGGNTMQIGEVQLYDATGGGGSLIALTGQRAVAEPSTPAGKSLSPTSPNPVEVVSQILDQNTATKWLSWGGATAGFIVTPVAGATTVQSLKVSTANDTPARDPSSYAIYGTNDAIVSPANGEGNGGETWTLIGSGRLNLPAARLTAGPVVSLINGTAYTSYKVVFPTNSGDTLFQIADAQLYSSTDGLSGAILATGDPIRAIGGVRTTQNSAGSFFAGYTGGDILPQGGPGTIGLFEMRTNGNLKRPEGTTTGTNNVVYANDSPALYARWGSATAPTAAQYGVANYPFARASTDRIDYGDDPGNLGTGHNLIQTEFLTSSIGTNHDQYFQMAQGCFQVGAAGRYTFTMRGDDGAQLAIAGATWVNRYADNGAGSFVSEFLQNGFPTGDTNVIGVVEFPAAGCYNFRYLYNEQGGGAFNEVLYAAGELSAYSAAFRQLGDPSGGLTLVDHTPITEMRSSSPVVVSGSPSTITLTWDSCYATVTTLNGGVFSNQDVTAQTVNGYGSVTIAAPATTTTYTITGTRAGAPHPVSSSSTTVFVDAPPFIYTFTADDTTLLAGAPLTLRWTGITGTTWSLSDGVNPPVDVTANTTGDPLVLQTGVITIPAPAADTTYSLTATNTNGTSTPVLLFIDIGLPPVLSLTSDKSSMLQGSFATLNWSVSGGAAATITPRLNNSSLSTSVPLVGSSVEQPQLTTTYVLTSSNDFGTSTTSVTVTLPERIGISDEEWTVQVDYWNRFGYNDPVYGNRTLLNSAIYQCEEMFAITDAAIGDRGPDAVANISTTIPEMRGPAVPPTAQPGNTNKVLMRYREFYVDVINYDEGLAATGNIPGSVRPPPGNTTIGGAAVTYENYALKATATLVVNAPGSYTLGINNDDGGRLRVDINNDGDFLDSGETLVQDETYHGFLGPLPLTGTVELSAGTYPIEYVYFEQGGGSGGEVFFVDPADGCRSKSLPIILSSPAAPPGTDVVISEFMAVNGQTLEDLEGSTPDWIELYNGTGAVISLNGYYLTDNSVLPAKWAFPATASIPAGGYLIVFASGKDGRIPPPPVTEFHTNFTLGGGAGYVALTKDDGGGGYLTVSSYNYPNQRSDVSYGWYDGTNIGYSATPTPGKLNMGGAASLVTGDTQFDVDRGIKTAAFPLTITATDATVGTIIRYTTDGSTPTELNGTTYTVPINISATTTLRARAMRPGAIPTNTDTQTYIFLDDVLTQNTVQAVAKGWPNTTVSGQYFDFGMDSAIVSGNEAEVKDALMAIPTVSVVTDITNLTDPTCGIFVESQFRGRAFERNCSVELINDDGSLGGNFQIEAGIRSRGGFSRSDGNPKHSWHLFFRNDPGYGGRLRYAVFGAAGTSRFEQLDLATANNYSWSFSPDAGNIRNFNYTNNTNTTTTFPWRTTNFIRDIASRDIQIDASGYGTRNKYVHLYLNGMYWGLHYFQERAEASFAEEYFGGDKDNYDVIKSSGNTNGYQTEATDGEATRGITGTATVDGTYASTWNKLYGGAFDLRNRNGTLLTTAAINDRNVRFYKLMGYDYDPGTQTATRNPALPVLLDVNSLVDYMVLVFYTGAYDAPLSTFLNNASNNWMAIRDRTSEQGFRFIVWDFEHGMGTDMLSGDIGGAGIQMDTDYSAGINNSKFVFSTIGNGVPGSFRSTNRLGPWAFGVNVVGPNPRVLWPTNQQWRGGFSASNPELYQNSYLYNNGGDLARANPQYLHEFLAYSSEYRRMFADRAQCLLRQGGPLTTAKVLAAIDARKAQLEDAVIAESARWGNAKGVALANYNKAAWLGAVQNIRDWVTHGSNQHVLNSLPIYEAGGVTPRVGTGVAGPGRAEVLISQLRAYRDGGNGGGFFIVTNKALTSNVATLTVQASPAHNITVGQSIVVRLNGADAVFDGTYTVTAVGANTISYAKTNANVAAAGAGGSITVPNVQISAPGYVVTGLFPGLDAPTLSVYGGVVAPNTNITLTNPNAANTNQTVYYSTSGVDPRPLGGGPPGGGATSIGPNGTVSGPATLTATGTLIARVYDSVAAEWSAAGKADFVVGVPASAANLMVTEINYNPRDVTPGTPTGGDVQTFEFIELVNSSAGPIDLTGVKFTTGITYTFPIGRILAAGERIVVVRDPVAFASRYPDAGYPGLSAKTVGPHDGNFDNGGERIVLTALDNSTIADITYNDNPPWPTTPDGNNGNGATLVFRTACGGTTTSYGDPLSWVGHQTVRGNPGGPDGSNYADWATANSASVGGDGDDDKDGIVDLAEYLLGGNPGSANTSILPTAGSIDIPVGMTTEKYQTITFTRVINTIDLGVEVQISDDLLVPNWTPTAVLVSRNDNGNGTETYVYRTPLPISGDTRNFMRVQITCSPIPPPS